MRPARVIIAKTVIQSPVDPMTAAQKKRANGPDVIRDLIVRGVDSAVAIRLNPNARSAGIGVAVLCSAPYPRLRRRSPSLSRRGKERASQHLPLFALLATLGRYALPAQLEKLGGPIQCHAFNGVGYPQ